LHDPNFDRLFGKQTEQEADEGARLAAVMQAEQLAAVEQAKQAAKEEVVARQKAAKQAEEEEARKEAEQARKQAEEEEAEEEQARKQAEQARKQAEEEEAAARKQAEEEAALKQAEDEAAAQVATAKLAEEEAVVAAAAAKKEAEEEQARKEAAEEQAARKQAEEEAARKQTEEEQAARQEAEEEEAVRKEAEAEAARDPPTPTSMPKPLTQEREQELAKQRGLPPPAGGVTGEQIETAGQARLEAAAAAPATPNKCDAHQQELNLGDEILVTGNKKHEGAVGKVVGFSPERIRIELRDGKTTTLAGKNVEKVESGRKRGVFGLFSSKGGRKDGAGASGSPQESKVAPSGGKKGRKQKRSSTTVSMLSMSSPTVAGDKQKKTRRRSLTAEGIQDNREHKNAAAKQGGRSIGGMILTVGSYKGNIKDDPTKNIKFVIKHTFNVSRDEKAKMQKDLNVLNKEKKAMALEDEDWKKQQAIDDDDIAEQTFKESLAADLSNATKGVPAARFSLQGLEDYDNNSGCVVAEVCILPPLPGAFSAATGAEGDPATLMAILHEKKIRMDLLDQITRSFEALSKGQVTKDIHREATLKQSNSEYTDIVPLTKEQEELAVAVDKVAATSKHQIEEKANKALDSLVDWEKHAKKLAKLAPNVGKNSERYEKAKDEFLQLTGPSHREALGALMMWLLVDPKKVDAGNIHLIINLAKLMIDAFCSMCTNPKTVSLACLLGEQLRVGIGVLSMLDTNEKEKKTLKEFKDETLSKLKSTQRQSARKLKSSKLPLNGLNFVLGCLQVGVEGLDGGELNEAGKSGMKAVGSLVKSVLTMKMDEDLIKNTKSFIVSGMGAALQHKAASVSLQILSDSAHGHQAALMISTFAEPKAIKEGSPKAKNDALPTAGHSTPEAKNDALTTAGHSTPEAKNGALVLASHSPVILAEYKHMAMYVQSLVHKASALPCVNTVNSPPRWEVACSTVDLLGNLLQHKEIKKYPELCRWLWDAHPLDSGAGDGAVVSTEFNDLSFRGLSFFLTYGDDSVQKQLGTQSVVIKQVVEWAKSFILPDSVGDFHFKDKIEDLFALLTEALEGMIQKIKNGIVMMATKYVERAVHNMKEAVSKITDSSLVQTACAFLEQLVALCDKTVTKILEPLLPVIERVSDVLLQLGGAKTATLKTKKEGRSLTIKEYLLAEQRKKIDRALETASKASKAMEELAMEKAKTLDKASGGLASDASNKALKKLQEQASNEALKMLQDVKEQEKELFVQVASAFCKLPVIQNAQKGAIRVARMMMTVGETLRKASEEVKGVQEEAKQVLQQVMDFRDAVRDKETSAGEWSFTTDDLTDKAKAAVSFFNTVVSTAVSSTIGKGYFTMPEIPDIQAIPAEFQEVIDFCSGSVKDMVKAIEDKAQEELLKLGHAVAEHLHIEGAMDFELEEATQLFRAVSFAAQDAKKIQKRHLWRVRERAIYWATMLSLPSEKPEDDKGACPAYKDVKRKIKGALTARKALEADSRVLKIADSPAYVAGMRSLMAEVWVDQEAAVKAEMDDGYAMCQQLKGTIEKEASPMKRKALLDLYKQSTEKLKAAASNMGGMQGGSLQISFLADLSESVMQLQETMKQMQASLHNIERGLQLLTGQPVSQVINFYCEQELRADTLPSKVYVPIDGVQKGTDRRHPFRVVEGENPAMDLEDKVMEFLEKRNKSVMLVSGYSGSGKSTLAKRIRLRLWKQHRNQISQREMRAQAKDQRGDSSAEAESVTQRVLHDAVVVPIWVHLPTLAVPLSDLMYESLRKQHGFGEAQLREFEQLVKEGKYKLVIVMDGVDELKKEFAKNNLYDRNDLELWGYWPTKKESRSRNSADDEWPKVLYFCRAEMLQPDSYPHYEQHFYPNADTGELSDPEVAKDYFEELVSESAEDLTSYVMIRCLTDSTLFRYLSSAYRTVWHKDGALYRCARRLASQPRTGSKASTVATATFCRRC
jgi:hypothetical protein